MAIDGMIVSGRGARMRMSFALTYEYEDVVASLLGGTVVAPSMPSGMAGRRAWRLAQAGRLLRGAGRRAEQHGADLVVAVGQNPTDLVPGYELIDAVDRASVRAAYIEELWVADLPLQPDIRAYLRRFDHVFLGVERTCAPLAAELDVPTSYLPPAVDQLAFTDAPSPRRDIAAYAMGRRNAAYHDVLLERAARTGRLYLYDTFTGNPRIKDHPAHRTNLRGLIRRTESFMVNVAKVDESDRTGNQEEVGFRYFEGAAGGAVMVGGRPDGDQFDTLFGWEDAVVEAAADGSDLDEILDELRDSPARVESIRAQNVRESLARHDVAHRVRVMLSILDVEEPASVGARLSELDDRASAVSG